MRLKAALLLLIWPCASQAEMLAEFSCVRPRAVDSGTWHNVSLAAKLVNGAVLAPGETFSFLKTIAPGYGKFQPGNTFSSGRVIKSLGGGYCQVSATIYNAALLAGLPILERYPHSFYDAEDAYVPPGQDAAVSGSSRADFRFINTTKGPLTIRASAVDGRVAVQLFGPGLPRKRWLTTEIERLPMRKMKRADLASRPGHDGLRVRRTMNVLDAQGNTQSVFLGLDVYEMVTEYE